jgi:hypothetical protein
MPDISEDAVQGDAVEGQALLQRIGRELSDTAALLANLQVVLGPPLEQAARSDPRLIPTMQGFDLAEQVLASLSGLLRKVGEGCCRLDPTAVAGALHAIPLADLQRRLRAEAAPAPSTAGDELDLFAEDEVWAI